MQALYVVCVPFMPKESYKKCEMLNEQDVYEVYVVEILLGESGYWLKYHQVKVLR